MNKKHGKVHTRLYTIFNMMKQRCENKKHTWYKNYGGKGIQVEWPNFESFYEDMNESHEKHILEHGKINTTLDRIDPTGNYNKSNCRWATRKEQTANMNINSSVSKYFSLMARKSHEAQKQKLGEDGFKKRLQEIGGLPKKSNKNKAKISQ